jgi:dGTPase
MSIRVSRVELTAHHNQLLWFSSNGQPVEISQLDLTRATLDGLIKYPELFDKEKPAHGKTEKPKFTYLEDKDLFDWVKQGITDKSRKPIEGEIADWADQVAYCVNDIEDSLRAGLLSFVDMESRANEISTAARKKLKDNDIPSITGETAIKKRAVRLHEKLVKPSVLRTRKINLKNWTSEIIKELLHGISIQRIHPEEECIRYQYSLVKSKEAEALVAVLKATSSVLVFQDPRVTTLEHKGGMILNRLFHAFVKNIELLPLDFQQLIKEGKTGSKHRLVADFVAGMTDRYAYSYFGRLFQPGSGSFYEDV